MKTPLKVLLSSFLLSAFLFAGCENDSGVNESQPELKIKSFRFEELDPTVEASIDSVDHEIHTSIPRTADIKSLTPTIEYTEGAELSPPSGYAYDFSKPLDFTLTKDERSVTYTAVIDTAESDNNELKQVSLPDLYIHQQVENKEIVIRVPYGTELTREKVVFSVSDHATVEPASGSTQDLSQPLDITVTSESGQENQYTLTVEQWDQETGIRAFWVPAPWHSPFLSSYEEIQKGVELAKELNFNTLYIGAWSSNKILYPSQTLMENSAYTSVDESLFGDYTGGSGDPLRDVVSVAHQHGLKVILWYEYGFMASWGTAPTPENNVILAEHPDWMGINNQGGPANYNGTDYYYNAYNPEVRDFMIDMVMEAVRNYNIDGIQGDDRMPAMPRNAGYDTTTIRLYKEDHGGNPPPDNYNESEWVDWRADILNNFWKRLYDSVKTEDPNCIVACAPNPYPWAFENLMQEWPVWLDQGTVEILSVQSYRTSVESYNYTINEVKSYFTSHGDGNLQRLVPGLLVYGSNGLIDPGVLAGQIRSNRQKGITGEAFFYDKPLRRDTIKDVIRARYPAEAKLPDFMKN